MATDWIALSYRYPALLIRECVRLVNMGGVMIVTPAELARRSTQPLDLAVKVLRELVVCGLAEEVEVVRCTSCGEYLDAESEQGHECPVPSQGRGIAREKAFRFSAPQTRDVKAVVTVHGMNTYGQWQEDFSWFVQIGYGYAIPTFVFKYGRILVSPLFDYGQERYVRLFALRLRSKLDELGLMGSNSPPDVIAHSFGTWIVTRALELDPELRFGRVVLTGSIVRPDFDWKGALTAGRVEAVLCHCGLRDRWVRLAPYFIPRSGPSGFIGFNDRGNVAHIFSAGCGHSDFFADAHFRQNFFERWAPFLTAGDPPTGLASTGTSPVGAGAWRRRLGHRLGQVLKVVLMLTIALLSLFVVYVFWRGVMSLGR